MNKSRNRYTGIILAISALVVIELTVLTINYFLSIEVAKSAEAINISGRQRMLSQRMTKSIYDIKNNLNSVEKRDSALNELNKASSLFNQTLESFVNGGEITTPNGEIKNFEPLVRSPKGLKIATESFFTWDPLKQKIGRVILANDLNRDILLDEAIDIAQKNNISLLGQMNDLTVQLENEAKASSDLLKLVQAISFTIISIMFFVIIFISFRNLRNRDEELQEAKQETEQILDTVDEGLFLVAKDLTISEQQSTKLKHIFDADGSGKPLLSFLENFISSKDSETTQEYFDLLFDKRKPEQLIGDLNPLKEVRMQIEEGSFGVKKKILRFAFKRVIKNQNIEKILTTISDITEEVELREELEKLEKEKSNQLETLSMVLNTDQTALKNFILNTDKSLQEINSLLKIDSLSSVELKEKVVKIIASIHGIKGESSALGITELTTLSSNFEDIADKLLSFPNLSGENFIPLTVELEKMIKFNEAINTIQKRFSPDKEALSEFETKISTNFQQWESLHQLTETVSKRQNKKVELTTSGLSEVSLTHDIQAYINTVAVQFIRNSITHGIEDVQTRIQHGKKPMGRMSLSLYQLKDKSYELIFKDDGHGIDKNKLLNRAIKANIINTDQAQKMTTNKTIGLLFHAGISTSESVDEDSGRGVGMSLILDKTNNLNGKIHIQTSKQSGTTFTIKIPEQTHKMPQIQSQPMIA